MMILNRKENVKKQMLQEKKKKKKKKMEKAILINFLKPNKNPHQIIYWVKFSERFIIARKISFVSQ